jgi:hypothetical protein
MIILQIEQFFRMEYFFAFMFRWNYNRIFENECIDQIQKLRRKTRVSALSTSPFTQNPSYQKIITWSDEKTVIEVLDSSKM